MFNSNRFQRRLSLIILHAVVIVVATLPADARSAAPTRPVTRPAMRPATRPVEGVTGGAIRSLESQVKALPNDPAVATRLGSALLDEAKRTHHFEDYVRATAAFNEALKRDPKYVPAIVQRGACALGLHKFDEAVGAADKVVSLKPDAAEGLALRGDAMLQLGDLARARADYEKVLAAEPDLEAQVRMANLQFAEGDAAGCLASLVAGIQAAEEAAAAPALVAWGMVRLGEFRFRTGNWDEAENLYVTAAELSGNDPDTLDHLAELYAAQGFYEKAIEHSDRALALAPRPGFYHARGDIHAVMNDPEKSLEWHQKAVAAYRAASAAGYTMFYHHLAGLYCDSDVMRDPAEAVRWARRDAQSRRTVATLDAFAWALYHDGKFAEAANNIDKAVRAKTLDSHVLYHASLIHAQAGDSVKARLYLRRAAAADAKFNEFHFHR